MTEVGEGYKIENAERIKRIDALVNWMRLSDVPTAEQLDPDNKLGLKDAFREQDGIYNDPIPESVLKQAKEGIENKGIDDSVAISLLKEQYLPKEVFEVRLGAGMPGNEERTGIKATKRFPFFRKYHSVSARAQRVRTEQHVPLFREQVFSAAQYLDRLGFRAPEKISGENWEMPYKNDFSFIHTEPTKDPSIFIRFSKTEPGLDSPVSQIDLVVTKPS